MNISYREAFLAKKPTKPLVQWEVVSNDKGWTTEFIQHKKHNIQVKGYAYWSMIQVKGYAYWSMESGILMTDQTSIGWGGAGSSFLYNYEDDILIGFNDDVREEDKEILLNNSYDFLKEMVADGELKTIYADTRSMLKGEIATIRED